jgi:phytoene dehydrogenase-like protein
MARFGLQAIRSSQGLTRARFRGDAARVLIDSNAAHSMVPLDRSPTAAFGLTLVCAGHAVGWPIARGGSANIARALAAHLRSLGGELQTAAPVESLDEARSLARTVLFDVTPRQFLRIGGEHIPPRYRRALERFRHGGGVFKVDWALDGPIPWTSPDCARAGTVHLAGSFAEFTAAEHAALRGEIAERPFVLLGQPTRFDASRAPAGRHTAWAYCHVPYGATEDMTARIEAQVERFAPGFRDRILARHALPPAALERHDWNLHGGDISAGAMDLRQLFFRPVLRLDPYATPLDGVFFCSASTPPGGAVHGMCGYYAARVALGRGLRPAVRDVADVRITHEAASAR